MTSIVQSSNPVLRKQAAAIPLSEITSPKIQAVIADMKAILATQKDGVAIAAPQIGHSIRLFLVSGFVMKAADKTYTGDTKDLIFINPEITKISRKKQVVEEGCLSVRWLYGKMKRAEKVTIDAYDETGAHFEQGAEGLLAQVFQHETDHLNGILFIDNAYDLEEMPPEDQEKIKAKNKTEE